MKFITQTHIAQVSGGKAESIPKRAEDIVSSFTKLNNAVTKIAEYIERIEEDVELLRYKARNI